MTEVERNHFFLNTEEKQKIFVWEAFGKDVFSELYA